MSAEVTLTATRPAMYRLRGSRHTSGVARIGTEPNRDTVGLAGKSLAVDIPATVVAGGAAVEGSVTSIVGQGAWNWVSEVLTMMVRRYTDRCMSSRSPWSGWRPHHTEPPSAMPRNIIDTRQLTCYCVVGGVKMHPRDLASTTPPLEPRQYLPTGRRSSPMRFWPSDS